MTQSRLEMELGTMQDHIWSEYELTYENAAALKRDIANWTRATRASPKSRAEIKTLGDINLGSIEEYKTVFERHSELNTQCEDLHKAKAGP